VATILLFVFDGFERRDDVCAAPMRKNRSLVSVAPELRL
jgi:hypothetical protein